MFIEFTIWLWHFKFKPPLFHIIGRKTKFLIKGLESTPTVLGRVRRRHFPEFKSESQEGLLGN